MKISKRKKKGGIYKRDQNVREKKLMFKKQTIFTILLEEKVEIYFKTRTQDKN